MKHHIWMPRCLLTSGHWHRAQRCPSQAGLLVQGGADVGQEASALIVL